MKIKLTIPEKRIAIALLNEFRGGFVEQAIVSNDAKEFSITEEDLVKADIKYLKKDVSGALVECDKSEAIATQVDDTTEFEMEIGEMTVAYLTGKLKAKDEAKEVGLGDNALVSLYKKLTV